MKAVEFYRTFRSYIDYIFNKSESFLIPVSKDAKYFAL